MPNEIGSETLHVVESDTLIYKIMVSEFRVNIAELCRNVIY